MQTLKWLKLMNYNKNSYTKKLGFKKVFVFKPFRSITWHPLCPTLLPLLTLTSYYFPNYPNHRYSQNRNITPINKPKPTSSTPQSTYPPKISQQTSKNYRDRKRKLLNVRVEDEYHLEKLEVLQRVKKTRRDQNDKSVESVCAWCQ